MTFAKYSVTSGIFIYRNIYRYDTHYSPDLSRWACNDRHVMATNRLTGNDRMNRCTTVATLRKLNANCIEERDTRGCKRTVNCATDQVVRRVSNPIRISGRITYTPRKRFGRRFAQLLLLRLSSFSKCSAIHKSCACVREHVSVCSTRRF